MAGLPETMDGISRGKCHSPHNTPMTTQASKGLASFSTSRGNMKPRQPNSSSNPPGPRNGATIMNPKMAKGVLP